MSFSLQKLAGLPAIAAAAFFMQALDATILNTALPAVARSLGRSPLAMQLAVVGYTLTVAMLIPVSGWLADRFGTRRVFISAVSFFILGSLLCALSVTLPMLVASRVLQGIGGAMMMPVARLAVLRAYPRTELVAVLNFISIPGLVGPVAGPLLGGWLVTYATWHWIFLINIPIGLIGILYAYRIMPDFTAPRRPFDGMGFALFGLSLVSFGDRVGPDFLPPVLLGGGIILLGLYIRHARRHPSPLIRLSVFRTRTFSVGIGGNIVSRLGTGCVPFLMPLMLQVGLGYPALVAGAMMAPTAIGSITAKTFAMKVLNRFGYRTTLTGVTVCIGLMIAQFSLQTPTLPLWMLILPLFMLGMAMSTQFTAMNSITLGDLSTEDASTGNGLLSVTQQLSISFGVASSTVVLRFYNSFTAGTLLDHFHYTFITIGGITMLAAFVFMLLRKDDGDSLLPGRKKPVFETTSNPTPRNP
ncbi:DHA2 family efflux MFS transporter permease subunit [uncultured Bilophila sp.]|uniref:DHA2 family efflux MFS transporter permease subunit n=1 Tax=uncultured Bilophila sp. TaxID=529385 RepID=UPI00280B892D|nr:DHA2 family efflux MFS transporter permease subunit [uncultured Bilophila sp.]